MASASTSSRMALSPDSANQSNQQPNSENIRVNRARQKEVDSLPKRPFPPLETVTLHGRSPAADQVRVVVRQTAVEQINAHALSDTRIELGGALLGRAHRAGDDGSEVAVDVMAAIPAYSADHGPIHFTFTADAWAQLHKDRAAAHPDLDVVGWFHTHPGLGVFYSSDDVVVHTAAFTLPWHVGLVVDPVSRECSFFGWERGDVAPINGFYELTNGDSQPIVPWKAVKSSVWDHDYMYEEYENRQGVDETRFSPTTDSFLSQAGLVAGVTAVLLTFFLLLVVILPMGRRVDTLETVALTLADETLATTNGAACPDPRLRIMTPLTGGAIVRGTAVPLIGTAEFPNAYRYRVEARSPQTGGEWALLRTRARGLSLGELAVWQTTESSPGLYEIRLTAVDKNNIILPNAPPCSILLALQ